MTLQIIRQDPIERKMSKGIYLIPGPIKSSDNVEQLSRLRREGKHSKVEEVLRYVEPRLRSIFIDAAGTPRVFTEIEGYDKPVPISLMGTGIVRLLSITLAMSDAAGGIVLVDEIENGLHHSVMQSVWDGIAEFAREFDVQVFATTHSWECARTAQQAFSVNEMVEDFRYHRVDRRMDTGEILVRTYSPESLEASFEIPPGDTLMQQQTAMEGTARKVVIVEGSDERRIFQSLSEHMGLEEIQFIPAGSVERIRSRISAVLDAQQPMGILQSLGVVRDADENAENAFKSVCDSLSANGLPVPANALEVAAGGGRQPKYHRANPAAWTAHRRPRRRMPSIRRRRSHDAVHRRFHVLRRAN